MTPPAVDGGFGLGVGWAVAGGFVGRAVGSRGRDGSPDGGGGAVGAGVMPGLAPAGVEVGAVDPREGDGAVAAAGRPAVIRALGCTRGLATERTPASASDRSGIASAGTSRSSTMQAVSNRPKTACRDLGGLDSVNGRLPGTRCGRCLRPRSWSILPVRAPRRQDDERFDA
jgi:hypothetical protein